jgi:hypothetical protein
LSRKKLLIKKLGNGVYTARVLASTDLPDTKSIYSDSETDTHVADAAG